MTTKVAINGFGRIGRNILRAIMEYNEDDIEVVAINDLGPVETNAHLFRFDTVHGRYPGEVTTTEDSMDVGRGPIRCTALRDPSKLPWGDVDVVLECTGVFRTKEDCQAHLENGSSRVLISAPAKGSSVDNTVVYGVNHETITADQLVISNASCTTNCLAPVAKVLDDEFGLKRGFMTTVHSYTGDQPTLDTLHKDLYRARAAAENMIPTSTGAAAATGLVLPQLDGKLDGVAIRVPTPNVSCVDLTFQAGRATSVEEINEAMHAASEGAMKGILGVTDWKLVSSDFNHDPRSSIFATDQTRVMEGDLCRILTWYDNEWAFSCRMIDVAREIGKTL